MQAAAAAAAATAAAAHSKEGRTSSTGLPSAPVLSTEQGASVLPSGRASPATGLVRSVEGHSAQAGALAELHSLGRTDRTTRPADKEMGSPLVVFSPQPGSVLPADKGAFPPSEGNTPTEQDKAKAASFQQQKANPAADGQQRADTAPTEPLLADFTLEELLDSGAGLEELSETEPEAEGSPDGQLGAYERAEPNGQAMGRQGLSLQPRAETTSFSTGRLC